MPQHRNFMSRHKQKHQEGNFVAIKIFMSRHTIQVLKLEGTKEMSRQSFLCRGNHKMNIVELCHGIFKLCHDIIPEKSTKDYRDITLQATTKS